MVREKTFSIRFDSFPFMKTSTFCALLLTVAVAFGTGCSRTGADNVPARVNLSQELKNRLGPDDGYAFALMYGADVNGSLDDCGCKAHPMGGLAWRMGYHEGFRAQHADVPVLQLDAGHMFTDMGDGSGNLYPDTLEKNKWIVKGYGQAKFTAGNLSRHELPYLPEILKKSGYDARAAEFPFIERLVSANIRTTFPDLMTPKPFLIEEVNAKRAGKTVRLGITGVAFGGPAPANSGYTIEDPTESLKKVVSDLRGKVDLVVVMAYGRPEEVEKLAEIPGIDVLIGAQSGQGGTELKKIGATSVVYTFTQTKQLGDLRVYLTPDGKIKDLKNKSIVLDKEIPQDPEAVKMVADAKMSIEIKQREQSGTQGQLPAGPGLSSSTPTLNLPTAPASK